MKTLLQDQWRNLLLGVYLNLFPEISPNVLSQIRRFVGVCEGVSKGINRGPCKVPLGGVFCPSAEKLKFLSQPLGPKKMKSAAPI